MWKREEGIKEILRMHVTRFLTSQVLMEEKTAGSPRPAVVLESLGFW
jgi:hypothetical protein